jgi:hypothetical protein
MEQQKEMGACGRQESAVTHTTIAGVLAIAVMAGFIGTATAQAPPPDMPQHSAAGGETDGGADRDISPVSEAPDETGRGTEAGQKTAAAAGVVVSVAVALAQAELRPSSEYQCKYYSTEWETCRGWLGVPYPCRKTKVKTKWCYDSPLIEARQYGLYCSYYQCTPDGIRRHWTGPCLALGTSRCYASPGQCSNGRRQAVGSCRYYVTPSIPRCGASDRTCGGS